MMQELSYIRCGDYYIPDIRLPKETRPIGRWGRMHRDYIKEHNPIRFNDLCLNGELWTYLADLNEQAQNRLELIIEQMKSSEGVTEELKSADQMAWVGAMKIVDNSDFGYWEVPIMHPLYDENGKIVVETKGKNKGKPKADKDLTDKNRVQFSYAGGVEAFYSEEVKPYSPDAWIDWDNISSFLWTMVTPVLTSTAPTGNE